MLSTTSLLEDDSEYGPLCSGCNKDIEEGSVIAFGDALFHLHCFVCAKCRRPADCESNLLLLTDGRPVCENCSYTCAMCKQVIRDEAIMTGDEAYHASCFRCVSCKQKIEDLVFTQTTKGIYCTPCHEKRRSEKQKRREERERRKQQQHNIAFAAKSLPSLPSGLQISDEHQHQPLPITTGLSPTPRPHVDRPYMNNRHASRLMDAQMVTNFIQTEEAGRVTKNNTTDSPPTPTRSRSTSMDDQRPMTNTIVRPMPSRSETIPAPTSARARQQQLLSPPNSGKRLSAIPDQDDSTSSLDLALPGIPSLNFSFFENDSAEILNLSKDLGASIDLDIKKEKQQQRQQAAKGSGVSDPVNEMLSLLDFPTPPAISEKDLGFVPDNVSQLKDELKLSKRKLADTEANFDKIKQASKRALDEFSRTKEEYNKETSLREQHEATILQLRQQMALLLQAQDPESFAARAKEDMERLARIRVELERTCQELKEYRQLLSQGIHHDALAILKGTLTAEVRSLTVERDALTQETQHLSKKRDDVINEMIMLNTKNAELTNMNNDLSRRVTEREREAAAVMAGTSFVRRDSSSDSANSAMAMSPTGTTTAAAAAAAAATKFVTRDSFNGTQAPKIFKIKKSNVFGKKFKKEQQQQQQQAPYGMVNNPSSMSLKHEHSKSPSSSGHSFQTITSFLRPVRCDVCGDKVWGRSDLRCQGCGYVCHSKCLSHAPQLCFESGNSSGDLHEDLLSPVDCSMFGTELSEQVIREDRMVPQIVEQCINAVEMRGLDYEGIYRKSGGAGQMRMIQQAFEQGLPIDLDDVEEVNDICAVTSVLKHYFRQLPNPLLTYELYSQFIELASIDTAEKRFDTCMSLLSQLPQANHDTLKVLIQHLARVRSRSSENLMTAKNLAVVFAPTLMRDKDPSRDLLDISYKNATIEYLINQAQELFP